MLKEVMPTMQLLRELHAVMDAKDCDRSMMCIVFEENNGAIELAKMQKMRPQTKHSAIKHRHFRSFVAKGVIRMLKVHTVEQETDFLTKSLPDQLFNYLSKKVLGW